MKLVTFNINDINRRLTNLLNWLRQGEPDIVCLQELKATDDAFPVEAIREAGFHAVWRGEKRWNSVAILARWAPVLTRVELPGDATDKQSRYLEAAINGLVVASIYAPNGNPQPGPKFDYKLAWLKRLTAHAADLYASGAPVVLAGDYNVVPTGIVTRCCSPRAAPPISVFCPKAGPTPSGRCIPESRCDGGLRLDHVLLSSTLMGAPARRRRRPAHGGVEGASDHAPVWVKLRDVSDSRGVPLRRARGQTPRAATTASSRSAISAHRIGGRARSQTRTSANTSAHSDRPLLVIDGDSFAHRSYHALPKTIRRRDGRSAGAILGFANFLLRLYADERPRAVIIGWDSLEAPTKRHEMFPAYQSEREFAEDLIEQLGLLPEFVAACGFANAKAPGFEVDDFLAAAVASEERAGGSALVASGDRDAFSARIAEHDDPLPRAGWRNCSYRS
jgi:exodeoxyribonuclease-3